MRNLNSWLDEYSQAHQNKKNQLIHRICVPIIFFTVVSMIHLLPGQLGVLSSGDILILFTLGWYSQLGWKAFCLISFQLVAAAGLFFLLTSVTAPLVPLIALFVLAWIGQFIGHSIEGQRPSFLKDLQFLLIGPIWVFLGRHD